ncbi:phosphotransferase-like protein [Luteipulveratus halotolerans]|uniref:phosphotransferase-like protein n=1 Tax=Luteipulveratus halotolerans TaxID=1631356 RepID=UPI000680A834|nr:hypothetical protein [Luteipulveratus halotolerans]
MAGNDVIADQVLSEPWWIRDLVEVWAGLDVLLVHVTCSAPELRRREAARGDRVIGAAEQQLGVVFAHGDCDLEVDSTRRTPVDLAQDIAGADRESTCETGVLAPASVALMTDALALSARA